MASYENLYAGGKYANDSPYAISGVYGVKASEIAFPSDPFTANQVQAISKKISTGSKNIEVSGLGLQSGGMRHLAAIPKQHWQEIDRLRKLTGVDLTFHGPLIEPTGAGREGWSEDQRKETERQGFEAVKLAQQMNPKGNVVVTFHSSNGLPLVQQRVKVGKNPDGSPKEKIVEMAVVDERTGRIGPIPKIQKEYLEKEGEVPEMTEWLKDYNKRLWSEPLQGLAVETQRAGSSINQAIPPRRELNDEAKENLKAAMENYKKSLENYKEYEKQMSGMPSSFKNYQEDFNNNLNYAKALTENSYLVFKDSFNKAMETATDEDKAKLKEYKKEALPIFEAYKDDKTKIKEFNEELTRGLAILTSLKSVPPTFKPLKDWAVEKAGMTFGNIAWNSYEKFKEHTPIISIENPPVGMSGLTRADEIAELITKSRKVFVENAVKKGVSEKDAWDKAKKIIGATWDVGHINSMRKWGYDEADVIREAKIIAPFVKHMHLADNLGFEDAELPIGMGNVPLKEILALDENFRKAKKAIETGDWFSKQGGMAMPYTPMREALTGLNASVYSMGEIPWGAVNQAYGGYFGGLGPINPPIHHSTYGAGFSGLPVELGGEVPGQGGQSRFSGNPME